MLSTSMPMPPAVLWSRALINCYGLCISAFNNYVAFLPNSSLDNAIISSLLGNHFPFMPEKRWRGHAPSFFDGVLDLRLGLIVLH